MAKYLLKASYTPDGTKGLLKEGGSSRKAAVQNAISGLGGKLESFYYAFGEPRSAKNRRVQPLDRAKLR